MILGGVDIIKERNVGNLIIQPYTPKAVGPNSYDVRLSNKLLRVHTNAEQDGIKYIDPDLAQKVDEVTIPDSGLIIFPWEFWLGATIEDIGSNTFVPIYEGRSTIARMGVSSHDAGFGDVGFQKQWTLEISCKLPFMLKAGMRVGQVYFQQVTDASMQYTIGHNYADQEGPTVAKAGNI